MRLTVSFLLCLLLAGQAGAESYRDIQKRRPDLFHPETGLRIARQRAPTPDDIPPPIRKVDVEEAAGLAANGAVVIDVFGASQSRYDELEGTWLVREPRRSLPGATWLPETGRGVLRPDMRSYLAENVDRLTQGDRNRPIVVFCIADCWMSWNAAQHIAKTGYTSVHWFRLGTDGWRDAGHKLVPVLPVPVTVE